MISITITAFNYTEWQIQTWWNLNQHPDLTKYLSLTSSATTYWQQGCGGLGAEIDLHFSNFQIVDLLSLDWKKQDHEEVGWRKSKPQVCLLPFHCPP